MGILAVPVIFSGIRRLATNYSKKIPATHQNKRYAFLRKVPMEQRFEIEDTLKHNFNPQFLFTSIYVDDCDIFLEMDRDNYNLLNLWHKSLNYKEHEFEQISHMNGYFFKTNVFIRLDTSFESKCPTIKTTFVKLVPHYPQLYNIRTQEPERIDEIIETFNNGNYFSNHESGCLLSTHVYFRQSLNNEELMVCGNNLDRCLKAVDDNNWKLVHAPSKSCPIILPQKINSFEDCLNYFDEVNNIYCTPVTLKSVFKRYQNNTIMIKPMECNKVFNESINSSRKKSLLTLMDFSETTTAKFKSKIKQLLKPSNRSGNKKKGGTYNRPFIITQIPQECVHSGFQQSIGMNDSNLTFKMLNLPNFKFLHSNEIRLAFSKRNMNKLLSLLNIPQEQIKCFDNRKENLCIYAQNYEQFESLYLQLNALELLSPKIYPDWVDYNSDFCYELLECWINRHIIRVIFRISLDKGQLEKFLGHTNFTIIYQHSNNCEESNHCAMYLLFEDPMDATNCLFKNGSNGFKIDMFSIFNSTYPPYPNQFRLLNLPLNTKCGEVLEWLHNIGIHCIVKKDNDFIVNVRDPTDIHRLKQYHFKNFPQSTNPVLFQHTTSHLSSCFKGIFNLYGFDLENFNVNELRTWLGDSRFNHYINPAKNCINIGTGSRLIRQLHFNSGKLSPQGLPIFVDFNDDYVDSLMHRENKFPNDWTSGNITNKYEYKFVTSLLDSP